MPDDPKAADPVDLEPLDADAVELDAPSPAPVSEPPPVGIDTGYDASGVPTFESVRERIETRYGTSIGTAELDAETPEGRSIEEQYEARQRAAAERLEQIRASMRDDT